ncbi:hypothetical protein Q8A67_000401 [Cirrhinus molitorella]|uniref:Nuclear body protein SP140-like protein n=1 Tax=Cirrhinus molitorella TaxID=172907 RepID=A0AA88TWS9_9TELE|nr:hypothetical protein Q8A67_000401 [Cirrhinus molitorella]
MDGVCGGAPHFEDKDMSNPLLPVYNRCMLCKGSMEISRCLVLGCSAGDRVSGQMDPLDLKTDEELLFFFHRKKTEISSIEQPHRLLTQLRDHDLVPEKLFENVKKMRTREQKEKGVYEVLDWVEKNRPRYIHQFWRCMFEDHILQLYPTLRMLRNSLLDGTYKLYEKPPDVETPTEEEESEGKAEKEKGKNYKRKTTKDEGRSEDSDDPSTSSASTPSQKKPVKKPSFSSPLKKGDKQIWMWPIYKTQLPVTCGNKDGTLYRDKLPGGGKCILSKGRWFTPADFEKFGGKERCKNWKSSIRCRNTPLKKLIEEGHLQCPLMERKKRTCVQQVLYSETSSGSVEESDAEDFQEQGGRGGGTEIRGRVEEEEEEEEDMADLSVFQAPSLPVTCVSLTGTLYKYRFASGSRGKCIRTEERWFTPEEFVKQELTLTDGHWKKDILCCGKMLNFLLKKKILRIHSLLCECVKCSTRVKDVMAQNSDDECYVCRSEGDLVCCDECPRAFHSHCHLPAVQEDSPGEWICTFCVLRNSQQWCESTNMSEQEAFGAPVSNYILYCHCLLLSVYREDIQKVFVEDPRKTVPRYSEFITRPMWLDKIKQKLESGEYQTIGAFISDFQLIFSNCSTFNRDSVFGQMGARLKKMFEEEFQKIFKNTEVFAPIILKGNDKDKHKNVYRFVCPCAGQFHCSLTNLVFVMEGEGEVQYETVSWDPHLLDGLGEMKPAGPLYDIDCFDGSISGLHLPHCEIYSEEHMDCLAVAHFTDGNIEKMNPLKVTKAHVMIDIKDLSIFGLIKRMIFPPSPVNAQVLVFLRPIAERQRENILDVHLLPWNVPLSETEVFEFNFGPNYHPTFEVFVNVSNKKVKLSLKDNAEGRKVWLPRKIFLTVIQATTLHPSTSPDAAQNTNGYQGFRNRACGCTAGPMALTSHPSHPETARLAHASSIHAPDTFSGVLLHYGPLLRPNHREVDSCRPKTGAEQWRLRHQLSPPLPSRHPILTARANLMSRRSRPSASLGRAPDFTAASPRLSALPAQLQPAAPLSAASAVSATNHPSSVSMPMPPAPAHSQFFPYPYPLPESWPTATPLTSSVRI